MDNRLDVETGILSSLLSTKTMQRALVALSRYVDDIKADDLEIVVGDVVSLSGGNEVGVIRSIEGAEYGIEVLLMNEDVTKCCDGSRSNVRLFHAAVGRFEYRHAIQKISNLTLLDVIEHCKGSTRLSQFNGSNEIDEEQFMRQVNSGDVVLCSNVLALVSSVIDGGGRKLYELVHVVSDEPSSAPDVAHDIVVTRHEIQRLYSSEELLEVISELVSVEEEDDTAQSGRTVNKTSRGSIGICDNIDASGLPSQLIVICPSCSYDSEMAESHPGVHQSETRFIPYILYAKNKNIKVIFLSSTLINPAVVDYYISLVPHIDKQELLSRVRFIGLNDFSEVPLTQKILNRPPLINRLRRVIHEFGRGSEAKHLMVWCKTGLEEELAQAIEIPLYGPTKLGEFFGSKAGSRQIFRDTRVPHAQGIYQPIFDVVTIPERICKLICRIQKIKTDARNVGISDLDVKHIPRRVGLKINDGFGGGGNAVMDIASVVERFQRQAQSGTKRSLIELIVDEFDHLEYGTPDMTWLVYSRWARKFGVIIEEWFENVITSPAMLGFVYRSFAEVVSIHRQVLVDNRFEGMAFPDLGPHRSVVYEYGLKIGQELRKRGGLETFSVDWVVCQSPGASKVAVHAVEINLRWGGSSVPPRLVKFLTSGMYNAQRNEIELENGETRCFRSYDGMVRSEYKKLLPEDVIELLQTHEVGFDPETKVGVVAHLLDTLSMYGKFGFVAIAHTLEECGELLERAKRVTDEFVGL